MNKKTLEAVKSHKGGRILLERFEGRFFRYHGATYLIGDTDYVCINLKTGAIRNFDPLETYVTPVLVNYTVRKVGQSHA